MAGTIAPFALVFLLVVGLAACGTGGDGTARPTATASAQQSEPTATPSIPEGALRVINRDQGGSGEYRFDPDELRFKVGEEVTLALVSETEFHTFTIEERDINVSMEAGETVLSTFTFDEPGSYVLICIPHRALGMVGEIVVE